MERENTPTDIVSNDRLLRVPEVARVLAVSRSAVYAWMDKGMLAYLKIGSSRRVPGWSVNSLVRQCLVKQ
jgi:excisionase family DNA binding protein